MKFGFDRHHTKKLLLMMFFITVAVVTGGQLLPLDVHAAKPSAYSKEYDIMVDPTNLVPPTRWHVPGVTPIITSMDPDTSDAFSTTEAQPVTLKPGQYRFATFTFDFPFTVTLEGKLEFARSLDQCVEGRGTTVLKVQCGRTQPYGGVPEYWSDQR